ncbi:hypothetical protein H5410_000870 [Solanum commersonii]|uniref:Uncharacterized protein n=1 Tax=Solanum commersonii TaxID=4109 RepID=A0A9J6AXP1_SOLCO|nr:hypothetical protein H5410_000870 [Solanum commersonii]
MGLIPRDNSQVQNFGKDFAFGGEVATLSYINWIGMNIDFIDAPMLRHFLMNIEKLVIKLDLVSTFGWESGTTFPKVLGDDFESLARERSLLNWLRQRYYISKYKTPYGIVD